MKLLSYCRQLAWLAKDAKQNFLIKLGKYVQVLYNLGCPSDEPQTEAFAIVWLP